MDASTAFLMEQVAQAGRPEDLFGQLDGSVDEKYQAGKRLFRSLSRALHPDVHGSDAQVSRAYGRVSELWAEAQVAIKEGRYGQPRVPQVAPISTTRHVYQDYALMTIGDLADVYRGTRDAGAEPVILKIGRDPADNDLLQAEHETLSYLHRVDQPEDKVFRPFLPEPLEHFSISDGRSPVRAATAFAAIEGLVSLETVREAYPMGIEPEDMAWMFRRLLYVLGYVHHRSVIHGAVLPAHVLIQPEKHGVVLVDWCYALRNPVQDNLHIPAISLSYEDWYPAEVLAKEPPRPGTDLAMAATTMVAILGGDAGRGTLPDSVPVPLRAFFRGCMLPSLSQRPRDAWELLEEFDQLIERLWGKRRFRVFEMPK